MNELDLHHRFQQDQHEFDALARKAERIRRHYLWLMAITLLLFLAALAVLLFAVPAYIRFLTTPNV